MSFKALGLDPNILTAIEEAGYTEPTPHPGCGDSGGDRGW